MRNTKVLAAGFVSVLLASHFAAAADLYVDQGRGKDTASGRSLEEPFATIGKAAAVAKAGDRVVVRAGIYRETVRPANSGREGAPIVFEPYRDEQVTISGAEVIRGWAPAGKGTYQAPMAGEFFKSGMNQADQVFVDGVMVHAARWPKVGNDISDPIKSTMTKFISKTRQGNWTTGVFEDDHIPEGADFTGAEIYVQPNHEGWGWAFSGKVMEHKGKRITLRSTSDSGQDGNQAIYSVGARYYVYNLPSLLTQDGEFFHDKPAGVLMLRTLGGDDPAKHLVEAKARDLGFDLTERSYITVKGLNLFACNLTTDRLAGGDSVGANPDGSVRYPWRDKEFVAPSHHIAVDGISASYLNHFTDISGHFFLQWTMNTGIVLSGSDHIIRNCRIRYSAGNGVSLQGHRHQCMNNLIEDCDHTAVDCAGISTGTNTSTRDVEIANNTIARMGRSGMTLRSLQNSDPSRQVTRIHHNDIHDYGLQDWDVGAFYTFGQDGRFTRIDHNYFHCSHRKAVGMFHGAYWDFSKNYVLDHNVIWGVAKPIQVTQDFDHEKTKVNNLIIHNNTAIANDTAWGYPIAESLGNGSVIHNNLLKVCVFKNPNGQVVNHWPRYGEGQVTSDQNVVFGDDPAGVYSKDKSLWAKDVYVQKPGFIDSARNDYRLSPGSPVLNLGSRLGPIVREGMTVVPAYDTELSTPAVGAYEDGQGAWRVGADLKAR